MKGVHMIQWPKDLPQDFLTHNLEDNLIRTKMDAGPDKVRRRFSVPRNFFTIALTAAQCDVLRTFYEADCERGAQVFSWGGQTYRFLAPPRIYQGNGAWEAELTLAG